MSAASAPQRSASGATDSSTSSKWRCTWRAHAEPAQRSHFSVGAPASMVLETDVKPVASGAKPLRNHRRPSKTERPSGPHPLASFSYARPHRKVREQEAIARKEEAAAACRARRVKEPLGCVNPNQIVGLRQKGGSHASQSRSSRTAGQTPPARRPSGAARLTHRDPLRCATPPPDMVRMWTAERDLKVRRRKSLLLDDGADSEPERQRERMWTEDRARRGHEAWVWRQASSGDLRRRQSGQAAVAGLPSSLVGEGPAAGLSRGAPLPTEPGGGMWTDERERRRHEAALWRADAHQSEARQHVQDGGCEETAGLPEDHTVRQHRDRDPTFHLSLGGFDLSYGKQRGNLVPQYHRHHYEQPSINPAVQLGRQPDGSYIGQWSHLQQQWAHDCRTGTEWTGLGSEVRGGVGDAVHGGAGDGRRVRYGVPKHHRYQFEDVEGGASLDSHAGLHLREGPRMAAEAAGWRPAGAGPRLHEQTHDRFRPHAPPPVPALR